MRPANLRPAASSAVTTLGSGVDGSVRRIETAFDTQGNAYKITSYDAATSGNIVNEVLREFNGLGQMTKEYQEHGGAVSTGSSLKVQYAYTEMASSANHSRLTSITYPNGKVLTYNYSSGLNSNISRWSSRSESGRMYEFDAWNRLIRIKSSGGSTLVEYKYDGLFRRIAETRSGTTTDFYYSSAWQVLEERVSGNAKIQYVWSPVYVDAMILRDRDAAGDSVLEERLWVMHDANFNVTGLLDNSGNVVERYAYDPFGVATYYDASWGSRGSSSYAWLHLHQGGRLDSSSGNYHFRFRDYSPTLGRWLTMDPIGYAAGDVGLYRYVGNTAGSRRDSLGLAATVDGKPITNNDLDKLDLSGYLADFDKILGVSGKTAVQKSLEHLVSSENKYAFVSTAQMIRLAMYHAAVTYYAQKLSSEPVPKFPTDGRLASQAGSECWKNSDSIKSDIGGQKLDRPGITVARGKRASAAYMEIVNNPSKFTMDCATFQSVVSRLALLAVLGEKEFDERFKGVGLSGANVVDDPFPFISISSRIPGCAMCYGFGSDTALRNEAYRKENTFCLPSGNIAGHPIGMLPKEEFIKVLENRAGAKTPTILYITDIPYQKLPK